VLKHAAQVVLSGCKPLRSGIVLRKTLTVLKYEAQVELSGCKPLRRCKEVESHSLGIVLRNTFDLVPFTFLLLRTDY
jgi:hypothetical protein